MTESVSYVKLLLKQGVSKGSSLGWELEVCCDTKTDIESLKICAEKAAQVAKEVFQKEDLLKSGQ